MIEDINRFVILFRTIMGTSDRDRCFVVSPKLIPAAQTVTDWETVSLPITVFTKELTEKLRSIARKILKAQRAGEVSDNQVEQLMEMKLGIFQTAFAEGSGETIESSRYDEGYIIQLIKNFHGKSWAPYQKEWLPLYIQRQFSLYADENRDYRIRRTDLPLELQKTVDVKYPSSPALITQTDADRYRWPQFSAPETKAPVASGRAGQDSSPLPSRPPPPGLLNELAPSAPAAAPPPSKPLIQTVGLETYPTGKPVLKPRRGKSSLRVVAQVESDTPEATTPIATTPKTNPLAEPRF
jgi:hypothetical protein